MLYRNEYKYIISAAQVSVLKTRAEAVMAKDVHADADGYNIRSVYFDDLYNSCYLENENGVDPREKFRIRIYNHCDARITLELKSKRQGKCLKQHCPLTKEQCLVLVNSGCLPESPDYPPLLQKLLMQIRTRGLRPVMPPGQHILEVKWDQVLPDFLQRRLMLDRLRWSAMSKFYLCCKFGLHHSKGA